MAGTAAMARLSSPSLVKLNFPLFKEAIHSGVPVISIPLVGDQPKNAALAEHHGFGIILNKGELSVESVSHALKEVVSNAKYGEAVKRLSKMMNHKPVSPTQLLVKWSEFAAEFQTLENLEPAGNKLNFFQYHSLDVIFFLIFIVLVIIVFSTIVIKYFLSRIVAVISKSEKQKTA
ncbi:hypothetical protein ANCCAN_23165 [Ancylostoma caninum]|uniref:glucuronosyltransferase n=1 Tax=Ancylostoma caninum TaxID=29170 RepID=A0A368FJT3_ANCCA|nr:hypothetical protein ANCCAN_23165 [Ancylostoma caninum]